MKKIILLCILAAIINIAKAQNSSSPQAGWGNLDYDIPESPAFKILNVDASDYLIKPSSVRDVAVAIGNYYVENGFIIPPKLAVEFSPLAFKPNFTLNDYNKNKCWNRTTFSLGTSKKETAGYSIAFGLKWTLIDNTDLRANQEFIDQLATVSVNDAQAQNLVRDFLVKTKHLTPGEANQILIDNAKFKDAVDEYNARIETREPIVIAKISALREKFKDEHWNDRILMVGLASLVDSPDSLIKNIQRPNKTALWLSGSEPLSKKGQWLYGIKGQMENDVDTTFSKGSLSLGSRLYYGKNKFKGFIEYQHKYAKGVRPEYLINLGLETNLTHGIWLNFALGVTKTGGDDFAFTPSINIKFGTPEKN